MKKSTKKLIIHTFIGILVSIVLYSLIDTQAQSSHLLPRVMDKTKLGVFICPFIGLIYWFVSKDIDD
ncbi:hypothetical protein IJD34_05770 [bacterium]|nr:hypothetical protein [bacterium]